MDFHRKDNETEQEYIFRICCNKAMIGTWDDVADILNAELGYHFGESTYRKRWARDVRGSQEFTVGQDTYTADAPSIKREIERAKIQYRDERNSWQRQNYVDARILQNLDYLEQVIGEIGREKFTVSPGLPFTANSDLLCLLSDLHIGQTFDNPFGKYNVDIARRRLNEYLNEVVKVGRENNAQDCYCVLLGDLISGSIHLSVQVTNRENVIQQVKLASELIASFVADLAPHFNHVYLTGVSGNHSRLIANKDKAIHDERLDDLILWIVKTLLKECKNVSVVDRNLDTGISTFYIRGHEYTAVHGDYDKITDAGVGKLAMMLGALPENILLGHLHYCELTERNGIRIVRGGSLAGSGDQYTVETRLTGKPQQMVCVCDSNGIKSAHPIVLK